mgnify:CR=1 FL=1
MLLPLQRRQQLRHQQLPLQRQSHRLLQAQRLPESLAQVTTRLLPARAWVFLVRWHARVATIRSPQARVVVLVSALVAHALPVTASVVHVRPEPEHLVQVVRVQALAPEHRVQVLVAEHLLPVVASVHHAQPDLVVPVAVAATVEEPLVRSVRAVAREHLRLASRRERNAKNSNREWRQALVERLFHAAMVPR